ncbi:MAG: AAA family ATPase [Gammaproteobacteria bacterium]|nr:AAA family ATPase [Gammaproteobacteria bacterium]NNF59871.1 AAA family ATPase [Gammaproteobacteria bacterium]NNM21488.1 AAA family ATPase [Gammaproteobacteria bacterium]
MKKYLKVVIAGRDKQSLQNIAATSRKYTGSDPQLQHITNGHADPLYGHVDLPDLLILDLAMDWEEQLNAIRDRPASARPNMIVIGPASQASAMRLAMRAGARDYLPRPVAGDELLAALQQLEQDGIRQQPDNCTWTSVIGVKGGVGASMVAANLAQLTTDAAKHTALIDLNLQAGSLAGYLDVEPRHTFREASLSAHDLDSLALSGYMTRTSSGLHLLAAPDNDILLPEHIPIENVSALFELIATNYQHVFADLPRHLDYIVAAAIEQADQHLVVMEQSVAALRETLRLLDLLGSEFGIGDTQIRVVINRHWKNASVSERQIRKNLGEFEIACIPNDFRSVSESLDIGVPVVSHARGSAAAKSLRRLGELVTGKKPERHSLVGSLTSMFRS